MHTQRLVIALAALVGLFACTLPWLKVLNQGIPGIEGDGLFSVIAFVVILVLVFIGNKRQLLSTGLKRAVLIFGLLATSFPMFVFFNFQSTLSDTKASLADNPFGSLAMSAASVAPGLYLTALMGLVIAFLAVKSDLFDRSA